MSSYARSQFDINNLEIYKEDSYNSNVRINNQEKINYSVYKSKLSEFELKRGDTEPTEPVIIPERTKVEAETDSIVDIPDNTSITSSNITTSSDKFRKTKKVQKSSRGDFFSFYDIIDPSMCFQSCYNHALLVNNVYPKAGEEGAKTNNLSFLMFYAKSRPQKLIKVGNYLEKKAKRDIWNSRPDLVKVTLTILDSLFNSCPQHMNLISKNAINIFYEILISNMDLLTEVTNTFVNFSSKHDHTTIDIDDSFHNKYLQVLKEFCKCCSSEDTNEQKRNETRLNGLKALHSVVSSNTFLISPNIDFYLIVIQPLVENILVTKVKSNVSINNAEEAKAHTLEKKNVSSEVIELETYALKSIFELMQKVTPATFEKIITPIYSFLNDKDQWSYLHYLTKILKIAMDAIQNQYRYLLITSLFKRLNDSESNKNDIKIQTNIIFVLTFVITSDERSIGLTCLELLDNLTKHLLISVKDKTNSKEDIEVFQSAVIDCIGTLARNIYYPEQTNDMLSFLINRLCFTGDVNKEKKDVPPISKKAISTISNTSINDLNEYLETDDIIKYRIILFHCLRRVLENRKVSDSNTSVNYTPVGIPIELITSTLRFLLTDSIEQKVEYFNFFACALPYIASVNDTAANAKKQTMMNKEYHFVLYDYLNKNDLEVIDYILIYNVLIVTLSQFFVEETLMTIPLIDKIQELKEEKSVEEQVVFHTILLNYMENIAATIKNDALTKYVNDVKEDRKSTGNYVELDYDPKNIYSYKDKTFKDLGIKEDVVLTPVEEYITRVKIDEFTGINEDLYKNYPILETKEKELTFAELVDILSANQNVKKTNSIFIDNKHNKLANISIPQLEPKIPDYINVDELKNALDVNVKNDYKLEDFNMDGYSNNNVLNNEVSRLLNEITLVNTTTTTKPNAVLEEEEEEEEEEEDNDEFATLESPTKSMSTGATTMINVSPTRSGFSPVTSNNKDIFINTEKNDTIQQQSLAYPKMEMQMSTLIIPNSPMDLNNRANTQSIYIKEPALR